MPRLPANYGSFVAPAKGGAYIDPAFGCTIKRLTDAATEYPGEVIGLTHQYSSVNPFNMNSTLVLLQKTSGRVQVRDLNGNILAGNDDLSTLGILSEGNPVWSRTDPNLLYFTTRQSPPCNPYCKQVLLKSYHVQTGVVTLLDDFSTLDPSFDRVQIGWGEGDISWDGTRLPLIACGGAENCDPLTPTFTAWVFVHSLLDGSDTVPQSVTGLNVDNSDLTPSNRMVVQRVAPSPGEDLYDENGLNPVQVLDYSSHWDRGRDGDGTDVFVIDNFADATPIPNCPATPDGNEIVKFRLADRSEQCLRTIPWDPEPPLDWAMGIHISCNNVGQDWCLVSTYSDSTNVNSSNWPSYANELLMIKLDGSRTIRLAHTRSSGSGNGEIGYWKSPRAAVSPDGKYVLFESDMSDNCETGPICPGPDVYLLRLPSSLVTESVVWTDLVNATAAGNSLQKTGGCDGCQDAGAASEQQIMSGDGYVEFTAGETTTTRGAGLGNGNTDASGADVNFGIALWNDGRTSVFENGMWVSDLLPYTSGDVFRVAVEGGVVHYYQNGRLGYTSLVAPTLPLRADTSLLGANSTINNAFIGFVAPVTENVVWTNLVNATAAGNSLQKTGGCDGCQDAGATSQQQITSGNGYLEFTAGETTTTRGAGLSNGNTDASAADVDFAIALWNDGQAYVFEGGTWTAFLSVYEPGDVFRVAVEGGVVHYYDNGRLCYTSLIAPTFPLIVDTSLLGANSTITNAVLSRIPEP